MSQPIVFSDPQPKHHSENSNFRKDSVRASFSRSERALLAVLGVGLIVLLVVAKILTANQSGLGTHQQLGLPPCSLRVLFGIRCPSCGMTTSWARFLDGDFAGSFNANCGGALLCLVAIVSGPVTIWMAWTGRGSMHGWFLKFGLVGLLSALAVSLVEWVVRLTTGA